mmetsp:Transcript_31607/g.48331  ORF Transcript_31607/g.48331 Transcript_31607/m.48331 type:complete len:164 (+) Transcript_31607:1248-1739(+)
MMFTSQVCLPEITREEQMQEKKAKEADEDDDTPVAYLSLTAEDDQDVIPLTCFYNGLSFFKRVPTEEEIRKEDKKIDLLAGFRTKDSFIQLKSDHGADLAKCKADLHSLYEEEIEGRQLDGLMPFQEHYLGNSYIDVFSYFCKSKPADVKSVKAMYSAGLDLQ